MKLNVGKTDKIIRLLLGVVIGLLGIFFKSWWGLIAIIPVFTALINWCPLYWILGLKTNKTA